MRDYLHSLIDWLFNKALHISGATVVFLSVIDISNLNTWQIDAFGVPEFQIGRLLYYITVALAFTFGIISLSHAKNISKLEKDIKDKGNKITDLETTLSEIVNETNELFNSYLKLLVKNLDFTSKERISVYKIYDDQFKLIGRSSVNPLLMRSGRPTYPIDEGFIGRGWAEGDFFIDDLPEPTARKGDTYFKKVSEINTIPREVIDEMNMHSRTYFIYRINGFDNNPKAVLVFESENEKAFDKEFIVEKLKGVKQPLVMFIEKNNGVKHLENNPMEI